MVAMVNIMQKDDLLVHAEPFISSLSRFMEDGPIAPILKSSLKGSFLYDMKADKRNS
jgi:hypothetical protein